MDAAQRQGTSKSWAAGRTVRWAVGAGRWALATRVLSERDGNSLVAASHNRPVSAADRTWRR
jgi:hypothetical protein